MTFSVCFVCRPSKADKTGLSPIEISLSVNNERVYITTTRKCKASSFDAKRQMVRREPDTNEFLSDIKKKLFECQTILFQRNLPITAKTVKDAFINGIEEKKVMLIEYHYEFMKTVQMKCENGQLSDTTFSKHLITIRNLKDYIKGKYELEDYPIQDINYEFIDGFFTFLRKTKSHNTALKDIDRFRQIVILSFNSGVINKNPFTTWKQVKEKKEVEFLTEAEINKIEKKQFGSDRLNKVRDVFVFCCYTALAYSDCFELTPEHIHTDDSGNIWIIKPRKKTNVMAKIPLIPKALRILQKYNFELPVLSNQKYNCYLDEIGTICNIKKKLHTHIARHSAATLFLNNGVPIEAVSKILGHTNIKQTQHYAKLLDKSIMESVKGSKLFQL